MLTELALTHPCNETVHWERRELLLQPPQPPRQHAAPAHPPVLGWPGRCDPLHGWLVSRSQ